ncbi:MAG: AMP-binding protein, partial [Oscillospiraceae bacterium]|nr:AMP-binding protein [Oscillospiraceae bacterium]
MERTVLEYLEKTARAYPDHIAFADDSREVAFRVFMHRAMAIGSEILKLEGFRKGPVAVLTNRTVESIEGYMGAMYAGCSYVPVDSAMPVSRMTDILEQIRPVALLYGQKDGKLLEKLSLSYPILPIWEAAEAETEEKLLKKAREGVLDMDPAYMLFTSGSTGKPKGIMISQRGLMDFTQWYTEATGITVEDRLGNQSPFYFDTSVKDIYQTLKTGATTYILPKKCFLFPKLLIDALNEKKITVLSWATAAFHMVANSGVFEKYVPQYVRRVQVGGEALQAKQLNIWRRALPHVKYSNFYGPTEVTVDCTWYPIERDFADTETIPIGKACANKEVLLFTEEGYLAKPGEKGEIWVRGSGLALGYFGDREKTEKAFV